MSVPSHSPTCRYGCSCAACLSGNCDECRTHFREAREALLREMGDWP